MAGIDSCLAACAKECLQALVAKRTDHATICIALLYVAQSAVRRTREARSAPYLRENTQSEPRVGACRVSQNLRGATQLTTPGDAIPQARYDGSTRRQPHRLSPHGPNHTQDHQAGRFGRAAEGTDIARQACDAPQGGAEGTCVATRPARAIGRPGLAAGGDRASCSDIGPGQQASRQAFPLCRGARRAGTHGRTSRGFDVVGSAPREASTCGSVVAPAIHVGRRSSVRHGGWHEKGLPLGREADLWRAGKAHTWRTTGIQVRRAARTLRSHEAGPLNFVAIACAQAPRVKAAPASTCASRESRRSAPVEADERAGPVLAARSRRMDRERLGAGERRRGHATRRAGAAPCQHRGRSGGGEAPERAGHDPAEQAGGLRLRPARGRPPIGDGAHQAREPLGRGSVAASRSAPATCAAWRPRDASTSIRPGCWSTRRTAAWPGGSSARLGGREGIPGARRGAAFRGGPRAPAPWPGTRRGEAEAREGLVVHEDQLRFVLREGRKRQIRRMCEMVGLTVTGLKRVRSGGVPLGPCPWANGAICGATKRF